MVSAGCAIVLSVMNPTIGSLFSGIGGFDLGFQRAGFDVAWQVEIDPWCSKVLAKHFPEAQRFEDVRHCGSHNLKFVDVICGGFPCQDISNAGMRAGIGGGRSGLWSEMCRIIGELRPSFVLVENVAALLGRGMGRVLGDLAEIGYDAEWEIVSAADVGAPHLRERIWIVAYPNTRQERVQRVKQKTLQEFQAFSWCKDVGRVEDLRGRPDIPEPLFRGSCDGVSSWVDRVGAIGNAVVPQIPELYARRINEFLREMNA